METTTDIRDRVTGGLLGLLVGDALGVPYEFHAPEAIPPAEQIDFDPPADFRRAHAGTPPGTWSDDGAQALCLLASLLDRGRLDEEDLARRFSAWLYQGYLAVDGRVYDVGVTTQAAIAAWRAGAPAHQAGPCRPADNGNGALMRCLPLALWHEGPDTSLVALAHRQSAVTHGHPRSQVCCALYCLWARRLLDGATDTEAAWDDAARALAQIYCDQNDTEHLAELEDQVLSYTTPRGRGYVVDTLHSARACLREPTYEAAVKKAVLLGHDTDTTACVAGGLAGILHGVEAIPLRWRARLRGLDTIARPLLDALLEWLGLD